MLRCALLCLCFASAEVTAHGLASSKQETVLQNKRKRGQRPLRCLARAACLELLEPRDVAAVTQLERAYGGATSFWGIQDNLCGKCVSNEDQENIMRVNKEKSWSAGIYGEIRPDSLVDLLRDLGARAGQRYYDLGSGAGKTVAIAAHTFGMNATGIELSKDRHAAACKALNALWLDDSVGKPSQASVGSTASVNVEFIHGSFFDYDFTDADIIFVDSVEFTDDMMGRIAAIGRGLRRGARIVSFRNLPGPEYKEEQMLNLQGNWGDALVTVVAKVTEPKPEQVLPKPSAATQRCAASWVQPVTA